MSLLALHRAVVNLRVGAMLPMHPLHQVVVLVVEVTAWALGHVSAALVWLLRVHGQQTTPLTTPGDLGQDTVVHVPKTGTPVISSVFVFLLPVCTLLTVHKPEIW